MSEPLVCAICLTKDRPEMLKRAVASFRAQTYQRKQILIVNSGIGPQFEETEDLREPCFIGADTLSIGQLRNLGCKYAAHHYTTSDMRPEIFVHFDDDDLSHPNRISEQVAHLQSSGADVVGYDELLFWREPICEPPSAKTKTAATVISGVGQAWIYRNKLAKCGSTFCYWRWSWQSRPFPDLPRPECGSCGEDWEWAAGLNMARVRGLGWRDSVSHGQEPRMICSIHGGNSSRYSVVEGPTWKRAPQLDQYCRERMAL